jgi:8-oxo-dGTP pyrophosphatase MutT (NUDIX family)
MGVRDRLANLRKVFGNTEPAAMRQGEIASGMTPANAFSPGEPIGPYDGFSRTPRSQNFVTGYNIATRPRTHERVAFETLRGLVEAYDVAQMCIWHRIDSIRSLDWSLIAAKGHSGDTTDHIQVGMKALAKPDRQQPFSVWLAQWLYDILAYDAGTLYRLRNRRGDAVGLRVVDGTSIAPLLDYWGNSPEEPAEAYVQYVNGLPWNWLTRGDLVYVPFRMRANSPYGHAPLESILLNANTDLRFQQYFLERFTEGNIPAAFASAPETWTPQQIEQFQEYWDAFMLGDQAVKSQIKWLPGGSGIEWSNEKDFSDHFSLFLMRKTCAAYHVVPSDLGFTENVNRSSGESQADVQHRVGDLPLIRHIQTILTAFLQDDLGLPLQFAFDLGEEQADRLQQAQADKIYMELGVIGGSDIREMRYGLPEPDGQPMPRFIYTTRSGPIPLSSLYAVAGPVDEATAAPEPGEPLPHTVFGGVEGVLPNPPIKVMSLAEQEFGASAMPLAPPPQPVMQPSDATGAPVAKDGAPAAGITTATGVTSYDLVGQREDEDDEDDEDRAQLAKSEMAAFRSFVKGRRRKGVWHDFEFRAVDPVRARRLNQGGRAAVRKAAGEIAVAGLAVRAEDTGRVLMLQRALDPDDPAAGCWEFPGGHLEGTESPLMGAWREWSEETGCIPPPGVQSGTWASGIYQGIVWTVPSEDCVPVNGGREITNPDDPDGDQVEAIAWWDPAQLPGNPAVRPELIADIDTVLEAFGCTGAGLAKSGDDGPKADGPAADTWHGWQMDMRAAHHWAPRIAAATATAFTVQQATDLVRSYLNQHDPEQTDRKAVVEAAAAWLAAQGLNLAQPIADALTALYTDAFLIGSAAAIATADHTNPDTGHWQPGDTAAAREQLEQLGATTGLVELTDQADETAQGIAHARVTDLARALAVGVLAGDSIVTIAHTLVDTLADPGRALAVALTEITRGSSQAAVGAYQARLITHGRWVTEQDRKVCPACQANADAGPIPIGQPYPGGPAYPPQHPHCRCALMPA